jgi:competence protein ComEA
MWTRVAAYLTPIAVALLVPAIAPEPRAARPIQAPGAGSRFPPGPGRDALFKVCKDCHGPESVLAQLKTHDEWVKTLDEMANNGAQGTDEEWNLIQAYLDQNYSLIFVNKAAARDLAPMLDLANELADAIVRTRSEKGNFKSIEDLKRVPGVDAAAAAKIDARKDRLIF